MLLGLGSGLPSYNLSVSHLALLELQRRCDEALEQGMCAVGTALELDRKSTRLNSSHNA